MRKRATQISDPPSPPVHVGSDHSCLDRGPAAEQGELTGVPVVAAGFRRVSSEQLATALMRRMLTNSERHPGRQGSDGLNDKKQC